MDHSLPPQRCIPVWITVNISELFLQVVRQRNAEGNMEKGHKMLVFPVTDS